MTTRLAPVTDGPLKGRGTARNPAGRFEAVARVAVDDGWDGLADRAEALAEDGIATEVREEASKSAITRNTSPDVPFDRSVNPYRGCEHGCIYCFARPSFAFYGLSPGLDFETKLTARTDIAAVLERELAAPRYRPAPLALGANTDPYQPVERRLRITRAVVEVLARTRHPFGIITKGGLVTRDIDLLAPAAADDTAHVAVSITTLDPDLARRMEPRAAGPTQRLRAVAALADAGVPVTVLASPMIPGLNDHELEAILAAAREAGATRANTILVRLPNELASLFEDWLHTHAPDRAKRVLSRIRQARGGKLNDARFGTRLRGDDAHARLLRHRFEKACARLGLEGRRWDMRTDLFRPPTPRGGQYALL